MSAIEKLKSVKNKILDKMITKEGLSEVKEHLILKGSYFRQLFSYTFFKKFKNKEPETLVDVFFYHTNYNMPKVLGVILLGIMGVSSFIGFLLGQSFGMFLFAFTSIIYIVACFIVLPIVWKLLNVEFNKKFNPENLTEIKEKIFENYDEWEIEYLFRKGLEKEELVDIFKEIEKLVGKEYFLEVFKSLNLHKQEKDISDPYILLLIINEIIDAIEKKTEKDCENNKLGKNEKIMDSLLSESKEKEKVCEYLK